MKKTLLLALTASAIALLACKETKKSTDIIVKKVEKKAPAAPVRMQEYNQTSEATLANSHLNCVIHPRRRLDVLQSHIHQTVVRFMS